MKRTLRIGLPIAVVAALIVAGVLLGTTPWSDGPAVQEAAAHPADYGICNVFIGDIPEDVQVAAWRVPDLVIDQIGTNMVVSAYIPSPDGQWLINDPETGEYVSVVSSVSIDAQTGEIMNEHYGTPEQETKLQGMLATLRVGPWEPAGPAWPRTDIPPESEILEVPVEPAWPRNDRRPESEVIEVLDTPDKTGLKYRKPEPGSGMVAGPTVGPTSERPLSQWLVAYTCDSLLALHTETGEVLQRDVVPEEEAMFQRFLDAVVVP